MLWTSRNKLYFEDKSFSETKVLVKAIKNAKEWQDSMAAAKSSSASPKDCPNKKTHGQTMVKDNSVACYSDAAWNSVTCAGGLGWTCSKPNGSLLFQGSASQEIVASTLMAEVLALKTTIEDAIAHGVKDLMCLSDFKNMIILITRNSSVISLQVILHDIGVLSRSLSSISFKFVNQNCNMVADTLPKAAMFSASNSSNGNVNSGSDYVSKKNGLTKKKYMFLRVSGVFSILIFLANMFLMFSV